MKTCLLVLLAGTCSAGDFINLTFNDPDLSGPLTPAFPGGRPLRGATDQLLRGWEVTANGVSLDQMVYSPPLTTSVGPVTLARNDAEDSMTALGDYTLFLDTFEVGGIRVSQQGTIPADAVGLWIFAAGTFQMSINGERIEDPRLGTLADPVIDVSRWAGQTVDLEFLLGAGNSGRLDVLGFTSVPEPSIWALLGLGAAALVWQRRRNG